MAPVFVNQRVRSNKGKNPLKIGVALPRRIGRLAVNPPIAQVGLLGNRRQSPQATGRPEPVGQRWEFSQQIKATDCRSSAKRLY
jgi:hypothetical protein